MEVKKFFKNDILFTEGSPGNDMYFITSGRVRVYKVMNGEKVELAVLEKGDFIGEMNLFLDEARSAMVEAIEDTEVQIFSKKTILEEIQKNPQFAYGMIAMLVNRIKNLHSIISSFQGIKKSYEIMYNKK